jgi:hypothetical protein
MIKMGNHSLSYHSKTIQIFEMKMNNKPVVLVVEDDPDINQLLCTILIKHYFNNNKKYR